jgi:precorrin-3B C17-methyltransferase
VVSGKLWVVGLGPGTRDLLTPQAQAVLEQADVVIGYAGYFDGLDDLLRGKERLALPLGEEVERARLAVQRATAGQQVCVISSGDAGVYGMASVVLEVLEGERADCEFAVVPGISAVLACAALLGAPLGHDFAVISLSDLLTPWSLIERRLLAAAEADFVLALFNPQSQRRDWQFRRAQEILGAVRAPETPVGVVRNAFRPGQSIWTGTLGTLPTAPVDMFTTVLVGNSQSRSFGAHLLTPRGYAIPSTIQEEP